jgi:DNA-binding MarR family transcriptional regulator
MAIELTETRLERNLSYNLSLLTFWMAKASREIYESRGLTNGQWKVLTVVASFGPLAPAEIALRVTLDRPAISRALRQLRDLRYVDYRDREHDLRSVDVLMTTKGRRTVAAMDEEMAALQADLFAGVSRDEERAFFTTAARLLDNMRAKTP